MGEDRLDKVLDEGAEIIANVVEHDLRRAAEWLTAIRVDGRAVERPIDGEVGADLRQIGGAHIPRQMNVDIRLSGEGGVEDIDPAVDLGQSQFAVRIRLQIDGERPRHRRAHIRGVEVEKTERSVSLELRGRDADAEGQLRSSAIRHEVEGISSAGGICAHCEVEPAGEVDLRLARRADPQPAEAEIGCEVERDGSRLVTGETDLDVGPVDDDVCGSLEEIGCAQRVIDCRFDLCLGVIVSAIQIV